MQGFGHPLIEQVDQISPAQRATIREMLSDGDLGAKNRNVINNALFNSPPDVLLDLCSLLVASEGADGEQA